MDFPEFLLRGLSDSSCLDPENRVSTSLFIFKDCSREDGFNEASITWFDDNEAFNVLWNQTKGGECCELQFRTGVAKLRKDIIDILKKTRNAVGLLDYERAPNENNNFHGNILLKKDIDKKISRTISGSLAMAVAEVILRESLADG